MDKKLLSTVIEVPGYISLYSYDISPERNATVIVVESYTQAISESLKKVCGSSQQLIILTRNDFEYGDDVYSIPLLHMKMRSVCERGDDILRGISIDAKHLRPHLEGMIRHVLIDLREALSRKSSPKEVRQRLLAQYDRILVGCSVYLGANEEFGMPEMQLLIDEKWEVNCTEIGDILLQEIESDQLFKLHGLLSELVEKVDGLG